MYLPTPFHTEGFETEAQKGNLEVVYYNTKYAVDQWTIQNLMLKHPTGTNHEKCKLLVLISVPRDNLLKNTILFKFT